VSSLVNVVLEILRQGFPLFPVDRSTKKPLVRWRPYQDQPPTEGDAKEWWSKWPNANIGMATGHLSGFVVIDCDSEESTTRFIENYPEAKDTLQVQTGRGRHYYFEFEEFIRNDAGRIFGKGIDIRGEGGFVILPPSVHSNGKIYEWLNDSDPLPLPPSLKQTLTGYFKHEPGFKSGEAPSDRIRGGQRNTVLTSLAGSMRQRGMTKEAIEAALHAEKRLRCESPLSDAEVTKIAQSIARYQPDSIPSHSNPQIGKETNFNPQSAAYILARKQQPLTWVWERYIAEGDLFVFVAYMKVGKSTLIYPLTIAVARGIPFLGYPTKKGAVLILALEEHPRDIELRLRKLGMKPEDPIYIHEGPLPNSKQELDAIKAFIKQKGIVLALLDSLVYFWNIKNENDNAEIVRALKPVLTLARDTGAAIGLIHHESKYGGRNEHGESQGDGKNIRGGSALFGIVDQAILLDRKHGGTPNQRVLKAIGRHAESPPKLNIELVGNPALSDPDPYEYHVLGTPEALTRAASKEKVFRALTDGLQSIPALAQKTELGEKTTREAAEELFKEGKAIREGKGVKGDPHTYCLETPTPDDQDSIRFQGIGIPSIGKETNKPPKDGHYSIRSQVGSIGRKETNPGNGEAEAQRPTPVEWPETDLMPTVWI